jgi:hypothetical protein
MKIRKRHISCMIILLLLGAGIGSSYFATAPAASNGPHKVIKHSVSLVAGDYVCFQDNLRNNRNKPLTIDITHTGNPDLEGINIILYWAVRHNHGYIRGDEIEFPITVKPHRTLRFFICYYTNIRLKPDTYILETKFNICEDDNTHPIVEITKPMKRSLYIKNQWVRSWWITMIVGGIDIEVDAYDEDGIDKVEFYIDKKLKSTDTNEPYTWTWDERAFGFRMIEVKAYDNADNSNTARIRVLIFNK